jgi:DNA-binding response OmpR family regulator
MSYRKTLLHVDDDPLFTQIVARRLSALGYEVASHNDSAKALEALSSSHHHVVLLDIDMPNIDGLELLRRIKTQYGGTQVIMLTGQVSLQSLLQSYRWGAEYCVFKPLESMEPLVEVIEAVFRKIDHWWTALERLGSQRRAMRSSSELSLHPDGADAGQADSATPLQS